MIYREPEPKLLPLPKTLERMSGVFWNPEANGKFLDELADALRGQKVLEVFAGNGYLAGLLHARGIEITATSVLSSIDAHKAGVFHPIQRMDAMEAVTTLGADHGALLMCWPTTTSQAVRSARLWQEMHPEAPVVYIGEFTNYDEGLLGGCATDAFFEEFVPTRTFTSYRSRGNMEKACIGTMRSLDLEPELAGEQARRGFRP